MSVLELQTKALFDMFTLVLARHRYNYDVVSNIGNHTAGATTA